MFGLGTDLVRLPCFWLKVFQNVCKYMGWVVVALKCFFLRLGLGFLTFFSKNSTYFLMFKFWWCDGWCDLNIKK